ncbi:hypothetical protein GGI17_000069 [Coemansia sp. S146]|nr:hypothetical protein GGI17_000069 [Coemansia sp. S146]
MLQLDAHAAAKVCKIATDLSAQESHIRFEPPLRRNAGATSTPGSKLGSTWVSLFQAPTQAITQTLFGSAGPIEAKSHLHPLDSGLLDEDKDNRGKGMVWLAWDDCRCLFQVFRALEYVDALGKPTPLVDTFASRMTAGEAISSATSSPASSGNGRRQSVGAPSAAATAASGLSGASRLWGWGSTPSGSEGREAGDTFTEEHIRTAAWKLVSSIFARATALKISAEAEEVSESDAQAVLTWFPRLAYLEIQSIPRASLRFWGSWAPARLSGLKVRYAGLDLTSFLDLAPENEQGWSRLVLLDLSGNPGIDQSPLRGQLSLRLSNVSRLSLAQCELEKVPGSLTSLYNLSWLDLNDNAISDITHISLKLGSIVRLNLARNHLTDLSGLRRMWALEYLDVSENKLDSWLPVLALRNLPSLSVLNVRGNPFSLSDPEAHHRPQIFSAFDHRDIALVLDGRGPTSQERREMAKIPRVATGHATSTSKASEIPAMKVRRPKVAVIEESLGDDDGDNEFEATGKAAVADIPASPSPRDLGANMPASPIHSHLGSLEKTPHVLRATELQAVTVASAHRHSNVAHFEAQSPAVHSISMKPRPRFKRRATASTVNGAKVIAPHMPSLPSAHTYSVPSSFVSTRPASPAPSSMAPSVRMSGSAQRDPERYRRRVEMMRAEAGSSWLRAFTELQSQSPTASPDAHAFYHGGAHFEQMLPRRIGSPSKPSERWPAQSRSEARPEQSPSEGTSLALSSQPDKPEIAPDTQLPSFLFPRRRTAARNREIASLPHYSDNQPSLTSSPHSPDSAALAGLAISNKENEDPVSTGSGESPRLESEVSGITRSPTSPKLEVAAADLSEVQQTLQDERASLIAEGVAVARCQFIPVEDMPTTDGRTLASGSKVVQRVILSHRTIYVSPTELIEVANDDNAADAGDNRHISARVPLTSLVRASRLGTGDTSPLRLESKCGRFDAATWIEFSPNGSDGFADLVNAVQAAVGENASRGVSEHLYKQAECLRCNWQGYVDDERTVFDAISDSEFTVIPPPATELQCPKCRRSYLREYYAADEHEKEAAADSSSTAQTANASIWKQPFVTRRNRLSPNIAANQPMSAAAEASERRARHTQHLEAARGALAADVQRLGSIATLGELPFAKMTNSVRLFLQLSVFEADNERLVQWVPAGLVRQMPPVAPSDQPPARSGTKGAASGSGQVVTSSKWGLSSFLGGATPAAAVTESEGANELFQDVDSDDKRRALAIGADWRASAALAPNLCEQVVYLALSSQAIYVFSPTWDAMRDTSAEICDEMDLRPERYLGLLFSLPLASLGRIDIGPNRQYLALHSALLAVDDKPTGSSWDARRLQQLLATSYPTYPLGGFTGDRASSFQPAQHQPRCAAVADGAASSCVFMIRDRLACSDLLDSLVEIGYETRVLDSGAGGEGSGRMRAINHDVEWAMHHLVQQVFLRPSTFDALDDDDPVSAGSSVRAVADKLVLGDTQEMLRKVRHELLRTRSGKQPGAMVDASSADSVIVDKVTYEFLKLYFCVGHVEQQASVGDGIQPLTLVGSPQFLYLVRERIDVWPPPVPDLRALYRKWQRIEPPTIVTSDPDTYDPQALTDELARRSNAPSSASPATSRAASSAATSIGGINAERSPTVLGEESVVDKVSDQVHAMAELLMSGTVSQYDRVVHARPIADLRRVALVPHALAVYPKIPSVQSPTLGTAEKPKTRLMDRDVLGCSGTSWHAMLRLEFATTAADNSDSATELDMTGWNVWFATLASAHECVEALNVLTKSAGVADVDFCEM